MLDGLGYDSYMIWGGDDPEGTLATNVVQLNGGCWRGEFEYFWWTDVISVLREDGGGEWRPPVPSAAELAALALATGFTPAASPAA